MCPVAVDYITMSPQDIKHARRVILRAERNFIRQQTDHIYKFQNCSKIEQVQVQVIISKCSNFSNETDYVG